MATFIPVTVTLLTQVNDTPAGVKSMFGFDEGCQAWGATVNNKVHSLEFFEQHPEHFKIEYQDNSSSTATLGNWCHPIPTIPVHINRQQETLCAYGNIYLDPGAHTLPLE